MRRGYIPVPARKAIYFAINFNSSAPDRGAFADLQQCSLPWPIAIWIHRANSPEANSERAIRAIARSRHPVEPLRDTRPPTARMTAGDGIPAFRRSSKLGLP